MKGNKVAIAKLLDVKVDVVKTRIFRAKLKLIESIEKVPETMETVLSI
ncbi:hypothetical protein [Sporosarcina sp. G11-34]|nr:hypothetical protein [Sporosarcina sp. G11-34]